MKWKHVVMPGLAILAQLSLLGTEILVTDGQNLQEVIDHADGGDIILIDGGTYGPLNISDRRFGPEAPLIIRGGEDIPLIHNQPVSSGRAIHLSNVSCIVFENLKIVGGMWGVQGDNADQIIIKSCEITGQGQEGIQFRNGSEYVDILHCHIHHTGLFHPQWGEGIYLGGENGGNSCFWIEGCLIHHCGKGEAINVKANECEVITIRDNLIHDIHPGTESQWNGGAIGIDQTNTDKNRSREIWIENNRIRRIFSGGTANGNTGIMTMGVGSYLLNNTIDSCGDRGIWMNAYNGNTHFVYVYNNTVTNCGQDIYNGGVDFRTGYPGENPNAPQQWYAEGEIPLSITTSGLPFAISGIPFSTYIDAAGGSGTYNWNIEGDLPQGIETVEDADKLYFEGIPQTSGYFEFTVTVEDDMVAEMKNLDLLVAGFDTVNLANHLTFSKLHGKLEPTHPVSGLWDGDWLSDQEGWPGGRSIDSFMVEFDFMKVIPISEIGLFGDNEGTWVSTLFTVETRSDTSGFWTPVIRNENCFGARWFRFDTDLDARQLRLAVWGNQSLHRTQVREFEIYSKIRHRNLELEGSPHSGGSVFGGGEYIKDSTVTVTAEPSEGYTFTGWYDSEGALFSTDTACSFVLTNDLYLEGRFSQISTDNGWTGGRQQFFIYPNPASHKVRVQSSADPVSGQLMRMNGVVVRTYDLNQTEGYLDLTGVGPGVYLLRVSWYEGSAQKLIVIME